MKLSKNIFFFFKIIALIFFCFSYLSFDKLNLIYLFTNSHNVSFFFLLFFMKTFEIECVFSQEMDTETQVQILDESVFHIAQIPWGKGINTIIYQSAMSK